MESGELARRVMAGAAPDAERELAGRMAERIRVYGLRHLRSDDAAAELVQEVIAIVLPALRDGRVEEPDHVERFVLGVCRNVVSGWRRGDRSRRHIADAAAAETINAVNPHPVPDAPRLLECMNRLPEREQSVVMMSYCQEHDSGEIGRLLDLTPSNVRVIRHRALRALRDCVHRRADA